MAELSCARGVVLGCVALLVGTAGFGALAGCTGPAPAHAANWLEQGQEAYQNGEYRQTMLLADRFLAGYADTQEAGEAYYLRGLAKLQLGEASAEQDLRQAAQVSRRGELVGLANLALGQLVQKNGDTVQAEQHYRLAASALPAAPPADEALYRLGDVLQRLGQWESADLHFDRLMYLFPDSSWAQLARERNRARAWTVRAGTFAQRRWAGELVERLSQAGLTGEIVPVLGDGLALAVQVGRFNTYDEAGRTLSGVRDVADGAIITTAR